MLMEGRVVGGMPVGDRLCHNGFPGFTSRISVVRVYHCQHMDEALARARVDVEAFAARPCFGLSDGDLKAAMPATARLQVLGRARRSA